MAGRGPLSEAEMASYLALPDMDAVRRTLANTHEFHAFFGSLHTGYEAWTVPHFLLRPPAVEGLAWRFQQPDLEDPSSQLCTASQFRDAAYAEIAGALGLPPGVGRRRWEQVWIVSVLATEKLIAPGRRGLGLAVENDRIAALLSSRGVEVLATDLPDRDGRSTEARRSRLFYPEVTHIEEFDQLVRFANLDPRGVADVAPGEFDFCWSRGVPGVLGEAAAALDFMQASLAPLRPGGLAVHTVEFNLTSNRTTWEQPDNVLLRRRDIEALAGRLAADGHMLLPLNTHPGQEPEDEKVRGTLGGAPGLRQRVGMMVSTSFGLAIRKAA
jgi:hypothetical protein